VEHFSRIPSDRPLRIWDVGANLGDWSAHALELAKKNGQKLDLNVFEPVPSTRQYLTRRLEGVREVTVQSVALSDARGTARMRFVGEFAGTNALATQHDEGGDFVDVEMSTGDAMADMLALDQIDLVKVDTEGHDLAVIRGFGTLLAEGRIGVFQFEYNHRWIYTHASLFQVFETVKSWPYSVGKVTSGGLQIYDSWNPEVDRYFEANYVLVRKDLVNDLNCRMVHWNEAGVLIF
jgi:FkbM family methyltransferase